MHLLFAQLTVRWISVITGAAHATSDCRAMSRAAAEPQPREPLPDKSARAAVPRVPAAASTARGRLPKLV